MEKINQNKKLNVLFMVGVLMLSILVLTMPISRASEETYLDDIYEVYKDAENLPEGVLLAPNPTTDNAENGNLDDIFEVYDENADKLEDNAVLSPVPQEENSNNIAIISVVTIITVTIIVAVIVLKKKTK